jgi:hypothetical protein
VAKDQSKEKVQAFVKQARRKMAKAIEPNDWPYPGGTRGSIPLAVITLSGDGYRTNGEIHVGSSDGYVFSCIQAWC